MTYAELVLLPALVSGLFLLMALTQILVGVPLRFSIISILVSMSMLGNYVSIVFVTRAKLGQGRTVLNRPLLGIRPVLAGHAALLVLMPTIFLVLYYGVGINRHWAVGTAAVLGVIGALMVVRSTTIDSPE